jgi:mRNA-degrading endonuclease toxin of MazEF toxin-antitoxin module
LSSARPNPRRGEIWLVRFPSDPPEKGPRPVIIVSVDARNRNERADTVLVIPLTTSIQRETPTRVLLLAAETGLQSDSAASADGITVIRKSDLLEPKVRLREVSNRRICELGRAVQIAIGCASA